MNHHTIARGAPIAGALLCALALPAFAASRSVNARNTVDPTGSVEVVDVAGSIDLSGWDQPAVEVTGSIGSRVERVDVTTEGRHTVVRVVLPKGAGGPGDQLEANLKIRVPVTSSLDVSLVSADLHVAGIAGEQRLQTVSGDISGEVAGGLEASTVSGNLRLAAQPGHSTQIRTVSGDIHVGGADGEVQASTVSGDAQLALGTLTRAKFESVSGDLTITGALGASGQLEASSVSGDVNIRFAASPDADVDIQTYSGDIDNCFGPKPVAEHYGPGNRLNFQNGKGGGRVHVNTQSGDVTLCTGK